MMQFFSVAVILGCLSISALSAANVFEITPKSQDVYQGRVAILQCSLKEEFEDLYTLTWRSDAGEVEDGRRHVEQGGQLRFDSVDKDLDSGQFRCIAISRSDPDDEEITDAVSLNIKWLRVSGVVRLMPVGEGDILPGNKIVLKCNVSGKPRPQIKSIAWYKNGVSIKSLPDFHFDISKGKLVIDKAELVRYDGTYSCCLPVGAEEKCSSKDYALTVRDKTVPVILERPKDITVRQNETAKFYCKFDAEPPPKIEWFYEGDPLKLKQTAKCRVCAYDNGTLVVKVVKDRFVGKYTCKATGINGNSSAADAKLGLAYIEKFSNPLVEEEFLDPGSVMEKLCSPPEGDPPPSIVWMKNGVKIPISGSNTHDRVTVSGRTLIIATVRKSDAGDYSCVASNMAGKVTKIFRFQIESLPKMQSDLVSRMEKEGTDVTLKCLADGVPAPKYHWLKNGTALDRSDRFTVEGGQLTIHSISLKDTAKYKCVAENALGRDESEAFVTIKERLKFDPLPTDMCAEAGETAEIVCGARGAKNPTVSWNISPTPEDYEILENSQANPKTLQIRNPKPGDSWTAFCTARSSVETISRDVTITVGKRPSIVKPPMDSSIFKGQYVRLDCGIDSPSNIKLGKLRWVTVTANSTTKEYTVRNNSDSDRYAVMNNGSFYVRNASTVDSGTYTCYYKDCGYEVNGAAYLDVTESDGPIPDTSDPDTDEDDDSTPQYKKIQTVALAAGCSVAYLILTITIIVYCRRKKRHKKHKANSSQDGVLEEDDEEQSLMHGGSSKHQNGGSIVNHCDGIQLEPVTHLSSDIGNLQYDHLKLEHVTAIGRGEFGEVYLSKAPGLFPDLADDVLVMVKKLEMDRHHKENDNSAGDGMNGGNDIAKTSRRFSFNREIRLLFTADHENVGKLLGVCSEHTESPTSPDYLITEYLEWGILKLCLQASRGGKLQKFNKYIKMKMCYQIAAGLEHLTKIGLTHQDVATRNCLVSSKLLVKLSVLNLTKEGFENEYSIYNGQPMPIRWMAPETLHDNRIELKSDVWSFGVTCWEIFTLGTMPFSGLSDEDFLEGMRSEYPPTLPALDGSKRVTSLISKCCQHSRSARPEFHQIVKKLQSILGLESKSECASVEDLDSDGQLLPANDVAT